jgi:rubrerythrin
MKYDFNADEVFKMAEQLERNGAKFYRDAAENMPEGEEKKMLILLADMEVEHEKVFTALHAELSSDEKEALIFDPEGMAAQYLKALADTRVFYEKTIDTSSMKEILKEALLAEKDSIVFYLGMKELVPGDLGKKRIDDIIAEEMMHIKLIGNKLREYK